MEDEPVDDITVAVLSANLEMETELAEKIEQPFHTDVTDDVVATTEGVDGGVPCGGIQNESDMVLQDDEFLYTKDGNYVCDICGVILAVRSSAERHMIAHFEKMVTEESESTCAATNDVTLLSAEVATNEIANESTNNPSQFELNVINIESNNDSLTLNASEFHSGPPSVSQSAESVSSNRHYKCDICGLLLSGKNSIVEQHVGSHFETKPFECYLCTFSTNEKYRIVQHMLTHFGWELETRPFTCSVCAYSSNEKSRLTRHMLIHSGEKPFACDVCGFRFNRKDSLTKHMRIHAVKEVLSTAEVSEVESDSHSSRHTSGTTASDVDLQPHSAATASSIEDIESPMTVKLERIDVAIEDVVMAGSENEPSQNQPLGNDPMQTVILSDKLDGPSNQQLLLKTSEIVSQDWGPFTNAEPEIIHTDDNFIQCSVCSYKTAKKYKYKLREHMNIHTGDRPFGCDLCDLKFSRKRTLDRHKLSHSTESPFACTLCDYTSKLKSHLTKHLKTHNRHGSSNGKDESNDTSHDSRDPLAFCMMESGNVDLSESCSLGDDVVSAEMAQNDIVLLQHPSNLPSVDPLQLRLNDEHSQDSGLSNSSGTKTMPSSHRRFTCDYCSYKSDRKFEFAVHLRTHTGEKPFACDLCDKRYIARKTLNRHRKTHLLEKRCGLCNFITMRDTDLATHLKTHTQDEATAFLNEESKDHYEPSVKPFQLELREEQSRDSGPSGSSCEATDSGDKLFVCDKCDYKTKEKNNLESHLMIHSGEKLFICNYCDKSFATEISLDGHIRDSHGDNTAVNKSDLDDHKKIHVNIEPTAANNLFKHVPPDDSTGQESNQASHNSASGSTLGANLPEDEHFSCVHCDFACDDITEWSEHMFKHTNEKSYSCDQCEYKTKFKASMDVHKTIHVEKKSVTSATVTCEFCDYPFTTKADMNLHIMSCHSELYISCDVCDFKAFHKRSLELHKATHLKPFACTICDYKVDKESLLTKHMITAHAEVALYACSSCHYKASSIANVEQHILATHGQPGAETASSTSVTPTDKVDVTPSQPDVKQYMCYACNYTASKIAQVEEHIVTSHAVLMQAPPSSSSTGLELYSCYACDYEANSVSQVEQHILNTHNAPVSETNASPMDVTTEASSSVKPL